MISTAKQIESTQEVDLSREEIIEALRTDPEFFIHFFLGDALTVPVPPFHIDSFRLMTADVDRIVEAIPRGHAKTTLARLACIWHFLFTDWRFIVYVSATSEDLAIPSVNAIIDMMLCDNFVAVFGELTFQIRRAGDGLYKFTIPGINKTCILRALGVQKTIRGINVDGERPQLAILDDIENRENINDERLYKKLRTWLYSTFFKALNQFKNKVIHIGNLIHARSCLNHHLESDRWYSRLYGCLLSNGQPLWPDLWPLEKLIADFKEYQEIGEVDNWFAEMMNLPIPPGGGIIKADEIYYRPHRSVEDVRYGFITLDLAISQETWAHRTVATAHGYIEDADDWQVLEYEAWFGIDPINLFYSIVRMAYRWRIAVIGIEDVAYQASLKFVFRYLALENRLPNLVFLPLAGRNRKAQRIITWASENKARKYALNEGDFIATKQLIMFDPSKKENDDDIIDSIGYGTQMKARYMTEIVNQQLGLPSAEIQGVLAISPI